MIIRIAQGAAALLAGVIGLALVGCADNDESFVAEAERRRRAGLGGHQAG
ncbi:hypothetical protein ACN27F_27045 [Solwaraspora sp. WMMB335]